jgi:hypothetical protein
VDQVFQTEVLRLVHFSLNENENNEEAKKILSEMVCNIMLIHLFSESFLFVIVRHLVQKMVGQSLTAA